MAGLVVVAGDWIRGCKELWVVRLVLAVEEWFETPMWCGFKVADSQRGGSYGAATYLTPFVGDRPEHAVVGCLR